MIYIRLEEFYASSLVRHAIIDLLLPYNDIITIIIIIHEMHNIHLRC